MRDSSAAASFSAGVAHHPDFDVELHQARFNLGQFSPRFLAGLLRFLHRFLNSRGARTECARQIFASCPDNDSRDDGEIEQEGNASEQSRR